MANKPFVFCSSSARFNLLICLYGFQCNLEESLLSSVLPFVGVQKGAHSAVSVGFR